MSFLLAPFKAILSGFLAFLIFIWTIFGFIFRCHKKPAAEETATTSISSESGQDTDGSTEYTTGSTTEDTTGITTEGTTESTTESTTERTTESTTEYTGHTYTPSDFTGSDSTTSGAAAKKENIISFGGNGDERVTGACAKGSYSYICGQTDSRDGDFASAIPSTSFLAPYGFISKYDSDGNTVWTVAITNSKNTVHPTDIAFLNSKLYVCGYYENSKTYVQSAFVSRYDIDGNLLWTKTFSGNKNVSFSSVAAVSDGFICGGKTNSSTGTFTLDDADSSFTSNRAILAKFDFDGSLVSSRYYAGSEGSEVTDLDSDSSDNVFAVVSSISTDGQFSSFRNLINGSLDDTVIKYDKDMNMKWYYTISTDGRDNMNLVAADGSGGCIAGGYFSSSATSINAGSLKGRAITGGIEAYAVKLNSSGQMSWDKLVTGDGDEIITDIIAVKNGYALVGYSSSASGEFPASFGGYDGFAYILSESGKKISYQCLGGSEDDMAAAASFTGSVLMVYGSSVSTDYEFDGLNQYAYTTSSFNYYDCFAAKYSTNL